MNRDTNKLLKPGAGALVKTVTLESLASKVDFEITGVRLEGKVAGVFDLEVVTQVEKRRHQVRVILKEYQATSYLHGKLIIETSSQERPVVELTLQAMFGKKKSRRQRG